MRGLDPRIQRFVSHSQVLDRRVKPSDDEQRWLEA
jgi:hypothetical protein